MNKFNLMQFAYLYVVSIVCIVYTVVVVLN